MLFCTVFAIEYLLTYTQLEFLRHIFYVARASFQVWTVWGVAFKQFHEFDGTLTQNEEREKNGQALHAKNEVNEMNEKGKI